MKRTYCPDKWVMLKCTHPKFGVTYKVLASWYGGFAGSNSWKLSSGTLDAFFDEEYGVYHFPQHTGSIYICHPKVYGMSMHTAGVLDSWVRALKDTDGTMEVMDENFDIASLALK